MEHTEISGHGSHEHTDKRQATEPAEQPDQIHATEHGSDQHTHKRQATEHAEHTDPNTRHGYAQRTEVSARGHTNTRTRDRPGNTRNRQTKYTPRTTRSTRNYQATSHGTYGTVWPTGHAEHATRDQATDHAEQTDKRQPTQYAERRKHQAMGYPQHTGNIALTGAPTMEANRGAGSIPLETAIILPVSEAEPVSSACANFTIRRLVIGVPARLTLL